MTDLFTESGNLFKMAAKIKSERIWVRGLETGEKPVSIKHGLRTADYGLRTGYKIRTRYKTRTRKYELGIKHGQGIKRGLRTADWV